MATQAQAQPQSQQPVHPSQAQGAQIPLQSFTLPNFPPEARGLKALTLTSDIKLDDYTSLLSDYATIPPLPPSIESLTLELFSLGYPPGFLGGLSQNLPNIKSLVVYSQLFGGISKESEKDGVRFFENLKGLRALHFLDVFAKPHFFDAVGEVLRSYTSDSSDRKSLMFLEINYSFRHEDEEFLPRIQATELPALIGPGLITCSLNISSPDVTDDPDDPTNLRAEGEEAGNGGTGSKEGIMAFNKTLATHVVMALTQPATAPTALRVLNTTLYTFSLNDLKKVLEVQKKLSVLSCTVEIEPTEACKNDLLGALESCPDLEQVEIVGNPSLQFYMAVSNPTHRSPTFARTFPSKEDMAALSKKCPKLDSFKATVLKTISMGAVEWTKGEDGEWKGGVVDGTEKQ
ncbi:hypothetical protein LTR04_001874 [Oleoguttula sp. CCFEE 6159]|nr:hypothetical protein LTR04_001874 [Oleoguttula sp. CCFEE 6159]